VIWVEERLTRLTASKFDDVFCLKKVSLINPEAPVKRIMYIQVSNKYVHWDRKQFCVIKQKSKGQH